MSRAYYKRKIDWADPAQRKKYNRRWMAAKRKGQSLGKFVTILGIRVRVQP